MRPVPLLSLAGEYLDRVEHLADVRSGQVLTRATSAAPPPAAASEAGGAGLFCKTSNVRFETAEALRQHYHSDWYRLNLKRAGRGEPPVSEAGFEALADSGQLADEELSGSDSDGGELEGGLTGVQEDEEGASSASAAAVGWRSNCGSDAPVLAEVCDGTVERSDEVGPRRVTEAADVLHPVEQKVRHRARPKGEHRGALTR
mmetsp:Transcript_23576/g.70439  ORF Transcript_23576/g.70439 Transcript_23576/m.70439 type:complete len:202 (+) Transcript_23576:34-639(+)